MKSQLPAHSRNVDDLGCARQNDRWHTVWSSIYATLFFAIGIFVVIVKDVFDRSGFLREQVLATNQDLAGDYVGIAVSTAVFLISVGIYFSYVFLRMVELLVEKFLVGSWLECQLRAIDTVFLIVAISFFFWESSLLEELSPYIVAFLAVFAAVLSAFLSHFRHGFKAVVRAFLVALLFDLSIFLFV